MLRHYFGWLISFGLILAILHGDSATDLKPSLAYTTPFRIEKVDHPASTYTGTHISLSFSQEINRAYISYYDVTHHSLNLAFNPWPQVQGSCNGVLGHWTCLTLDGDGANGHTADDVGMHSSVDVNALVTGVSYYDVTHRALKYAQYDCFFACNLTLETVDDPGTNLEAGSYGTALKFTSAGVPYIAYSLLNPSDSAQDALKLAHRVPSGGNCGDGASYGKWQCDMIDKGTLLGQSPSIELYENSGLTIQLAYLGGGNVLKFAVNPSGENCAPGTAAYWRCSVIDTPAGGDLSLHSYNTLPGIAYFDPVGHNLRYAAYVGAIADANCGKNPANQFAWRCDTIEPIGKYFGWTRASISFAYDSFGYPAIAYQNVQVDGPTTLKIARPLGAYNYDVANCGPVPSGGFMGTWLCSTVDGGGANTDEAAFTAIGLRKNSLAIIAFTEDDAYAGTQRLMVAMQQIYTYLPTIKK